MRKYYILNEYSSGTSTHTGKIKSSMRITKALEKVVDSGGSINYSFEDGTQGSITPGVAKILLDKYNKMSPFDQAEASKYMRTSYKNFIAAVKG